MSDAKTLRWPGIPSDGRYGRDGRQWFDPACCMAEVSEPPHYIYRHQCSRRAVVDGLCRQHAKQRDRWLKATGG